MFCTVTRLRGDAARLRVERSRTFEKMIHMSGPPVASLTEGQAVDLINALEYWIEEIWGDSGDCESLAERSASFKAPSRDPETLADV